MLRRVGETSEVVAGMSVAASHGSTVTGSTSSDNAAAFAQPRLDSFTKFTRVTPGGRVIVFYISSTGGYRATVAGAISVLHSVKLTAK